MRTKLKNRSTYSGLLELGGYATIVSLEFMLHSTDFSDKEPGYRSSNSSRSTSNSSQSTVLSSLSVYQFNTMATSTEGWKRSGLIRGPGIPAPSGQYQVGCTSLMHKFADDTNTLLVRLFYPCQEGGGRYEYGKWIPHRRYSKGYKAAIPNVISTSGLIGIFTGNCLSA